ncbi:MAG: inorganic phosphate transporter [Alphaproteobacteria bacterium]|nr:inorganic phosphate transporter [Alphaproteobacteria bacterium]MBU0798626.1 inorganic phosphate transporter [Alphaproteobacteria bacterium]MBU0888359.1 inorganic phosphate transporter [Alphaproteobacteria bacterium]MBU1814670.1 inorganic phosphate transporter [Alphaproteobacteria bacterium]
MKKTALDKDLRKLEQMEAATHAASRSLAPLGIAFVFLLGAAAWTSVTFSGGPFGYLVVISAVIVGYMALNIGANDVANNMGPAVGSKALTMGGALVIAALAEASGALLAGGDVVSTVANDLLRADAALEGHSLVFVMLAALLASALWVNLATILGAPVSTTHAVVGGVVGAGIAAAGFSVVVWPTIGAIAASWVISPALGGIFSALFLAAIRRTILQRKDRIAAARCWVPILVAAMAGIFAAYLATKGLRRVWSPGTGLVLMIGVVSAMLAWLAARPWIYHRSQGMENRNRHVSRLFRLPLICAAALLSFAHGANDVANAVGPFAAIVAVLQNGGAAAGELELPLWVLAIGAIGIALGLALFGPRMIRMVGEKITKMNETRAYCVALSAATTVLIASALGLPVSSTHIAVGAIFGVGFLREFYSNQRLRSELLPVRAIGIDTSRLNATPEEAVAKYRRRERRRLVRRRHVLQIVAAWVITVPATAVLSGLLYLLLAALML